MYTVYSIVAEFNDRERGKPIRRMKQYEEKYIEIEDGEEWQKEQPEEGRRNNGKKGEGKT